MPSDFYEILGIPKNASAEDIKRAYRKKAMEHHPDRHGGDKGKEADFKKINEAYATLSDEQKRAYYDRYGTSEGAGGFNNSGFDADFDIGDIFESFFGGAGFHNKKRKTESGEDIEIQISLDFSDALFGLKKSIKFNKKIICDECSGSGGAAGSSSKTCISCHGSGYIKKRTQSIFGYVERSSVCPTCNGEGVIIEKKCPKCDSLKRIIIKQEKEIEIPAGINDGMTLKLKGEGSEGLNGKDGNLYISFKVPSSFEGLRREQDNLYYDLNVDPIEAILGAKKKVKLPILGDRIIEIKSGAQHSEILKFKGDGVKNVSEDFKGDLFVSLQIKIPTYISKKEKELYEQIAKEKGIDYKKGIFWN